jgi:hypothetical protein
VKSTEIFFQKSYHFKSYSITIAGPWKGPWASLTPIPATGRGMGGAGRGGWGGGPRKATSAPPPGIAEAGTGGFSAPPED